MPVHDDRCPRGRCRIRQVQSPHGAAFLLAVYLSALVLLLLGGVSLQRINMDVRAAQLSAQRRQAFYLSEAALDDAIAKLRDGSSALADDTDYPLTTSSGSASFRLRTRADAPADSSAPIIRDITARGSSGSATSQVTATASIVMGYPDEGIWAGDRIILSKHYPLMQEPGDPSIPTLIGTFRAAGGHTETVTLYQVAVNGSISVGPSGYGKTGIPYNDSEQAAGLYVPGPAGMGLHGSGIQTYPGTSDQLSQSPQVVPLTIPERVDRVNDPRVNASTAASVCRTTTTIHDGGHTTHVIDGTIRLTGSRELTITDGGPLDLSPPGDNRIVLCLQSLIADDQSEVRFTSPATIYLVGGAPSDASAMWRDWNDVTFHSDYVAYGQNDRAVVQAIDRNGNPLHNGIELVIPPWAVWNSTYVHGQADILMAGGTFFGSVSAPNSFVTMTGAGMNPIRVVGKNVLLLDIGERGQLFLKRSAGDGTPNVFPGSVSVVSWTTDSP